MFITAVALAGGIVLGLPPPPFTTGVLLTGGVDVTVADCNHDSAGELCRKAGGVSHGLVCRIGSTDGMFGFLPVLVTVKISNSLLCLLKTFFNINNWCQVVPGYFIFIVTTMLFKLN